jgi:hypothetical protein
MEKIHTIHHLNLNQDEIILACSIINRFGSGQHPYADSTNYHGFAISYLKELIEEIHTSKQDVKLTSQGHIALTTLEEKLKNVVTI